MCVHLCICIHVHVFLHTHMYIYTYITFSYCGQESLGRNGVAIVVNKRVQNAVLGCNLRNNRMISVRFQGKPFNIFHLGYYNTASLQYCAPQIHPHSNSDDLSKVHIQPCHCFS